MEVPAACPTDCWVLPPHSCRTCRQIEQGDQDVAGLQAEAAGVEAARAALQQEVADAESEVAALQAEKEIQAGGEVKELQKEVDELSMK